MIDIDSLQFQKLDFAGLQTLVEWAKAERWNPGPHDAEVFWATDPDGYYGFYQDRQLIAGGAIISYRGLFGFMGLFIVMPEFRGLGVGRKLWHLRRDMLISRLREGASIGMDGVIDMQPFYRKGGFQIAFRDERHEKIGQLYKVDSNISPIEEEDFSAVLAYDKLCFGFSRPQFMMPWLKQTDGKTFKYVVNNLLQGFAFVRKASSGYKICPLFADNKQIAEELYKACLDSIPGKALYLDIPMSNPAAVALTKKHQTSYVFECARMYYSSPHEVTLNRIFGITTFELG